MSTWKTGVWLQLALGIVYLLDLNAKKGRGIGKIFKITQVETLLIKLPPLFVLQSNYIIHDILVENLQSKLENILIKTATGFIHKIFDTNIHTSRHYR